MGVPCSALCFTMRKAAEAFIRNMVLLHYWRDLLFNYMVWPAAMYVASFWGLALDKIIGQVLISWKICSRNSSEASPHCHYEIILAEFGASPHDAIFPTVTYLHRIWSLPITLVSSIQWESSEEGWYHIASRWPLSQGRQIDRSPNFQYSIDGPNLHLSKQELNQIILEE